MSLYTTGEIAKRCGVTVRTVQYYDTRELLTPSQLSEGGRRLYSEADVERLEVICLLRELGLSIAQIGQLLREQDPGSVINLLLEQQSQALEEEITQRQTQLDRVKTLRRGLKDFTSFSLDALRTVAQNMSDQKRLRRLYALLFAVGLAMEAFEFSAILLWGFRGVWWPLLLWAALLVPFCILFCRIYFGRVAYICPQCHQTFRARQREAFFARHTLRTRRLTCPCCGHRGFCVEVWGGHKE